MWERESKDRSRSQLGVGCGRSQRQRLTIPGPETQWELLSRDEAAPCSAAQCLFTNCDGRWHWPIVSEWWQRDNGGTITRPSRDCNLPFATFRQYAIRSNSPASWGLFWITLETDDQLFTSRIVSKFKIVNESGENVNTNYSGVGAKQTLVPTIDCSD